ncbi:MAG: aldo/keto reductase, partial [Arenicellales bacterium]
GAKPEGCRWTMVQRNGIFRDTDQSDHAISAYKSVADKHGLDLAQMSLAWVYQFKGVTSTIMGATSMAHLKSNIDAHALSLGDDVLADITAVIQRYPAPF